MGSTTIGVTRRAFIIGCTAVLTASHFAITTAQADDYLAKDIQYVFHSISRRFACFSTTNCLCGGAAPLFGNGQVVGQNQHSLMD
jgi:hypothetical protein